MVVGLMPDTLPSRTRHFAAVAIGSQLAGGYRNNVSLAATCLCCADKCACFVARLPECEKYFDPCPRRRWININVLGGDPCTGGKLGNPFDSSRRIAGAFRAY